MANGVHKITAEFEEELCKYTGAPYCVCVDNQSNALFLALFYYKNFILEIEEDGYGLEIPSHTYPSVPCEMIHAGFRVDFINSSPLLKGEYQLYPSPVWDSALRFTANMYRPGQFQCISFTGPYKHFKLGKGGAILCDNEEAYKWFKKARFSGRDECSYLEDDFDNNPVIGWNFYMPVETATRGLHMILQFYNRDGSKKENEDLELPYPDLSKFKLFR